jgi:hypothetical protein
MGRREQVIDEERERPGVPPVKRPLIVSCCGMITQTVSETEEEVDDDVESQGFQSSLGVWEWIFYESAG